MAPLSLPAGARSPFLIHVELGGGIVRRIDITPPNKDVLDLQQLGQGASALTPAWEQFCGEAERVCLEERGHVPGIDMGITGFANRTFILKWVLVTNQVKNTYEDREKATE